MNRGRKKRSTVHPKAREIVRREAAEVEMRLSLTDRPDDVRMTLPVVCHGEYREVPDEVDCYYLTGPRLFLVDLPQPEVAADE
jgi:hypothetical protein